MSENLQAAGHDLETIDFEDPESLKLEETDFMGDLTVPSEITEKATDNDSPDDNTDTTSNEMVIDETETIQQVDEVVTENEKMVKAEDSVDHLLNDDSDPIADLEIFSVQDTANTLVDTPHELAHMREEPVDTHKEPVVTSEESVIMSEEPVVTLEKPVFTPEEPVVTPEEPVIMLEEPVVKESVDKPVAPVDMPEKSVDTPEILVEDDESGVEAKKEDVLKPVKPEFELITAPTPEIKAKVELPVTVIQSRPANPALPAPKSLMPTRPSKRSAAPSPVDTQTASPTMEEDFVIITEMDSIPASPTILTTDDPMTDDPDALDIYCEEDDLTEERSAKLWISNLNRSIRPQHLRMAFADVVDVTPVEVDLKSYVKYYAFIKMKSAEKAKEMVAKFHNKSLMGNKVQVEQVLEQPNLDLIKKEIKAKREEDFKRIVAEKKVIVSDLTTRVNQEKKTIERHFESVKQTEMVLSKLRQSERKNEIERDKIRTEVRKMQEESNNKRYEVNKVSAQSRRQKEDIKREREQVQREQAQVRLLQQGIADLRRMKTECQKAIATPQMQVEHVPVNRGVHSQPPKPTQRLDNFARDSKPTKSKSQWAQTATDAITEPSYHRPIPSAVTEPVRLDRANRAKLTPRSHEEGWKEGWRPEGWKDTSHSDFSISIPNELASDELKELDDIRRERAEIERFRMRLQIEREEREKEDKEEIDRFEQIKLLSEKEEFIKREEERIEREKVNYLKMTT